MSFSIKYSPEGIELETNDLTFLNKDQLPLTVKFLRNLTDREIWSAVVGSHSWATFPDSDMMDVQIEDAQGVVLKRHKWDVVLNGSFFYQTLWNYCLKRSAEGKPNKGLAVGTHNGEFGEWVPLAQNSLSEIVLVEGSTKQFEELFKNFTVFPFLTFINEVVTPDGEDVIFYEGGQGYTNSVRKDVIEYWEQHSVEKNQISETHRKSLKFNDLVKDDMNWLHLDVEGIDDQLLMSLDENKFKNLDIIIFEYNNLSTEKRENIDNFMKERGYQTYRDKGICLARRE